MERICKICNEMVYIRRGKVCSPCHRVIYHPSKYKEQAESRLLSHCKLCGDKIRHKTNTCIFLCAKCSFKPSRFNVDDMYAWWDKVNKNRLIVDLKDLNMLIEIYSHIEKEDGVENLDSYLPADQLSKMWICVKKYMSKKIGKIPDFL